MSVARLFLLQQLSGEKHFDGDEHNAEYDHEAFVGKDDAKVYDQLSPDESQKRLGLELLLCLFNIVK